MAPDAGQHPPIEAAFRALQRLDADALVAVCEPDVSFESRITAVEDSAYEGHDGIRRYIDNLKQAFEWIDVQMSELVEDADSAVFTNRFHACGRGSGIEVEHIYYVGATGRDERLVSWRFFDSRADALEALGLRE